MIGGLILLVGFGYFVLSKYVIKNAYENYGTKKAKYIATAIMVLIPIWDIVLGYPIYAFLCLTNSGVKIYQTVENVEGFYVGEDTGTYSKIPPLPYNEYGFIDYKKRSKSSEPYKYYRVSWIDANTTSECIQIGNASSEYDLNLYKKGKCVVKVEIAEREVSQWEYIGGIETTSFISFLGISKSVSQKIIDRKNREVLSEIIEYPWNQGWLINSINHIIPLTVFYCKHKIALNEGYINTLKPNKGEN